MTSNSLTMPTMLGIPDVQIFDTDHIINTLKAAVRDGVLITSSGRVYTSRRVYDEMYQTDNFGNANKFEKLTSLCFGLGGGDQDD